MDFLMDILVNGRRIRTLTIVDDRMKEAVDLVVNFRISGYAVTRILDQVA